MVDPLVIVLATVLGAVIVVFLVMHHGRFQNQRLQQLQVELDAARGLMGDIAQQMAQGRAETAQVGEQQRASAAQFQADNVTQMQNQMQSFMSLVQQQLESVQQSVEQRMGGLTDTMGQQLSENTKVIHGVQGQLGGLAQSAKTMETLGRDIAGLQEVLRAPKVRGNLGERILEEILGQVLPQSAFEMQKKLPGVDGGYVVVDAVVHLANRMVPIDSKFPLESFERVLASGDENAEKTRREFLTVVKKHIDVIAEKYIRPDQDTYDFALMYLPAENVYYEAVVREHGDPETLSVVSHAAKQKVVPVSPNSLYAYLGTIAYGLKGLQVEKQAAQLRSELLVLQKRFARFYKGYEKVGRNVGTASRAFEESTKQAEKLNEQMGQLTGHVSELDESQSLARVVADKRQMSLSA